MDTNQKVTDNLLLTIADYVASSPIDSDEAYATARLCLGDTLGCALLALNFPACTKLLGPVVPHTIVPGGSHVPGTNYALDPIQAAFNIGTMIRWLDFNDTWLAKEWGHPSDNLGGILSVSDYLNRNGQEITVRDLLTAMIKAHEIQGILALENSFNNIGFDHVILVKVATSAVVTSLLGGNTSQIADAISQAWIDTGPLRTYRHAPNTGSRKSWAAGDATARGVMLAMMTMRGEKGYTQALSAKRWGLYDALLGGHPLTLTRPLGSYVMENILFKVAFPAEFHAQTAVEAPLALHPLHDIESVKSIEITTTEPTLRIIDKRGPLHNPADRDHCLQYMVAIALIKGSLTANDYEDEVAQDPRIDQLRAKMEVKESKQFTKDYLDPEKRSIANTIVIILKNGKRLGPVTVEYPLGHKKRREEGIPLLYKKLQDNLETRFSKETVQGIIRLLQSPDELDVMPVATFVDLFKDAPTS